MIALGHGTGAVVDVQLLEDVGHLGLHCALADGQESAICLLADPLAISWRTSIADSRCWPTLTSPQNDFFSDTPPCRTRTNGGFGNYRTESSDPVHRVPRRRLSGLSIWAPLTDRSSAFRLSLPWWQPFLF